MAPRPTVIYVGSSNCRGLGTNVLAAQLAEWERCFGVPFNLSGQGSVIGNPGTGFPIKGTMPAIFAWTAKLPYAVEQVRPILVGDDFEGATLDYTGDHVNAAVDSWVFIATNSNAGIDDPGGQGNFRKVVSDVEDGGGAGIHRLTVDSVWLPAVHGDGTIAFFPDSYTVLTVSSDGFTLTKTDETPDWAPDAFIGKAVVTRRAVNGATGSRRVVANTTNTLTLDANILATPLIAGDSFHLMLGAGAAETLAGLAAHAGASFRPLQVYIDTAPFHRAGQGGHENIHNQPGHAPTDLTFNAMPELMRLFRTEYPSNLYSLCMGRDSATISPNSIVTGSLYHAWQKDLTMLDFNPSSPNSMFVAMASAILSMQVLLALQGDTMDVVAFVLLLAENDAQVQYYPKIDDIGDHIDIFIGSMRGLLQDPTMPFVAVGPSSIEWLPRRDEVYTQLERRARTDPWYGVTDTRPPTLPVTYVVGENPPVHLDTLSQTNLLAPAIFATWQDIIERNGVLPDFTTFVVEDGQALVDANAFCTVEFSDAYLLSLEDPAEWRNATSKVKKDAIRRMSRWISIKKRYQGQKREVDQGLAFPRHGLTDDDGYLIAHDSVPLRVQQATAYGAWRIVKGDWDPFPDESIDGGLQAKSIQVGPIQIDKSYAGVKRAQTETRLPIVDGLLSHFTISTVAGRLGRG